MSKPKGAGLTSFDHIQLLKMAEQQFRLACTVHFALHTDGLSLDAPIVFTFGRHQTDYKEFGLRFDQAEYAASSLEYVSTFVMAATIAEAFKDCVPNARDHPDRSIADAFKIVRMLRNAFAHGPLRPVWDIRPEWRNRSFTVPNVISLDTTALNAKVFDWDHYGGHLAIWRLSIWFRFNCLNDTQPVGRIEPPYPKVEAWQRGREIYKKISDLPNNDNDEDLTDITR